MPDLVGPLPRLGLPCCPPFRDQRLDLRDGKTPLRRLPLPVATQIDVGLLAEKSQDRPDLPEVLLRLFKNVG